MTAHESPWPPLGNWDWWPLARLLTVLFILGAAAHGRFGWRVDPAEIAMLPRRVFEALSFCALISFGLAHLYLIVLMFPLYAVVTLNDAFYDFSRWLCRVVLRMAPGPLLALSALGGEIALFGVIILLLRRFLFRL